MLEMIVATLKARYFMDKKMKLIRSNVVSDLDWVIQLIRLREKKNLTRKYVA